MLSRRRSDALVRSLPRQLRRPIATTANRQNDHAGEETAAIHLDRDGGTGLLRLRKHGNPPLPISPLLVDDKPRANRRPKASREQQKREDLTEFQKALASNPHATSYVLNHAAVVAHLAKKSHWRTLVTERMKQHFAPLVQKNAKTINVKDFWSWNADATQIRERLERDVLNAVMEVAEYEGGRLVSDGDVEAACVVMPWEFTANVADFVGVGLTIYRLPGPPAETTASEIPLLRRLDLGKPIGLLKHDLTTNVQLAFDRLAAHTT
ncbi:hypothetical protein B0A48_12657 [Cryoendolithus antarcticus]|uniref:Uncharacterized protein n=1 Tax=Cryoendolithus antarcticus TaxID=1507870 RepID=A0A1V8SRJ0_9PEZI|nr:hypothetical protein B0A48_12657 [Cryoendolithus antarcticus]